MICYGSDRYRARAFTPHAGRAPYTPAVLPAGGGLACLVAAPPFDLELAIESTIVVGLVAFAALWIFNWSEGRRLHQEDEKRRHLFQHLYASACRGRDEAWIRQVVLSAAVAGVELDLTDAARVQALAELTPKRPTERL